MFIQLILLMGFELQGAYKSRLKRNRYITLHIIHSVSSKLLNKMWPHAHCLM